MPDDVIKSLKHELQLIERLQYAPYFLTVNSIVRFARSKDILCQGRGSAANSAVCYVLGITSIDPARNDLLFERFVSEERREPSKAALNHITRLLAVSLAPDIRVNAVAPGLVDTPLTADWTAAQQLWRERSPMRRATRPKDIAQVVAMLVASDYLTGEVLTSDGGLNLT